MQLKTQSEIDKFLKSEKFFSPESNTYCLGKTREEAAEICRLIISKRQENTQTRTEEGEYVGMVIAEKQNSI